MTREELESHVVETLADLFEIPREEITPSARFVEDLDLDSIDAIDLAVKIREQTGKSLEEEQLRSLRTVSDIVDLLAELLNEEGAVGSIR